MGFISISDISLPNRRNGLLVSSMQRLNELAAARNGADGIPSVVGAVNPGEDSSVTTADGGNFQKMKDLSTTIIDHGKKMISVAKNEVQ